MRTTCMGVLLAAIVIGAALPRAIAKDTVTPKPTGGQAVNAEPVAAKAAPKDAKDAAVPGAKQVASPRGESEPGDADRDETARAIEADEPTAAPSAVPSAKQLAERRDPFRPFLKRQEARKEEPEGDLIGVTALELRQLTLVGVLLDMSPPRALLQDSGGMGYVVTPGTRVGRHGGVVAAIEPGRMTVEETRLDFYGREEVTRQVLESPQDLEPQTVGGKRREMR